jgi:hypothetical protein
MENSSSSSQCQHEYRCFTNNNTRTTKSIVGMTLIVILSLLSLRLQNNFFRSFTTSQLSLFNPPNVDERHRNDTSTISRTATTTTTTSEDYHKAKDHVHVMFGLSGNASSFLEEFTMSLKSVLLNAPIFSNLTIHILADHDAYAVLYDLLSTATTITSWITYHQITIHIYNIEARIWQWKRWIEKVMKFPIDQSIAVHTIGAFFRLFAHRIVVQTNPNIHHLLYMDTDVMIMANLEKIWQYTRQDMIKDKLFLWGYDQCSGFVMLNVPRMETIWELASTIDLKNISTQIRQNPDDQLIFRSINVTFPNEVGIMDDPWDVTIASIGKLWSYNITERRGKGVGMLHFNGGRESKENAFKSDFIRDENFKQNWATADYYVRLPWNWVKFIVESHNVRDHQHDENMKRSNNSNNQEPNQTENMNYYGFPLQIHQHIITA